uniref:DNA-directed RNA polymerase RpoA/D/Rpb3-type domain-containing protein n=1 Tax=viral metagenome TaxID=1070528 RepID=A0A6C0C4U2_9ZZZZ
MSTMISKKPKANSHLISFKRDENGILNFGIDGINVSFVNAIRRTILADIPTLVFNCFPHEKNDANFHVNTSRLNNEILKQRLSCIPIHISDVGLPYKELVVEINVKNESENTIDVTTEHFRIKNTTTGKYLQDDAVRKIFPPCPITGDFVLFARLRPEVSTIAPGEELSISAKMSLHTAGEDGAFNVSSTCAYKFTSDKIKQDEAWQSKLVEISEEEKANPEVIGLLQQNWYNHDGLRYFKKDSFEFKLETVGVFTNEELVLKACEILIEKLTRIGQSALDDLPVEKSVSTIKNSVDVRLDGYGYTVGKIIEYVLNKNYYQGDKVKTLSYVGFRKDHPHDNHSKIRMGFINDPYETENIPLISASKGLVRNACDDAIQIMTGIMEEFQ